MNMKKVIKSTRLLALLAALLFTTLVQAQIEVGEYVEVKKFSYEFSVIKTYFPTPLQVGRDQLIERFNKIRENVSIKTVTRTIKEIPKGYWHNDSRNIKALDDRFKARSGTMFYYSDIIVDEKIKVYED